MSAVLFLLMLGILFNIYQHGDSMDPRPPSLTPSDLDKAINAPGSSDTNIVGQTDSGHSSSSGAGTRAPGTSSGVSLELQRQLQKLSRDMQHLQNGMHALQQDVSSAMSTREAREVKFIGEVDRIERKRQSVRQQSGPTSRTDPVAFSASVSGDNERLGWSQTIQFGSVPTNLGRAFDARTGKFRCPVKGLYHFWLTINSFENEHVVTEIVVNGEERYLNHAGGRGIGGAASTAVSLVLQPADSVWIRLHNSEGTRVSRWWSNFNGLLLQKMS